MIKTITTATLQDWLNKGECLLIDVREAEEFHAGHILGARFHPLSSFHDNFSLEDIPTTQKIVFQCRSGKRSDTACRIVSELSPSHTEIYNLEGGILAWQAAGLPVIV